MSVERRIAALERRRSPAACRRIELVEVFGLPPEERERRIRAAEERAGPWRPGDPSRVVIVDEAAQPGGGDHDRGG